MSSAFVCLVCNKSFDNKRSQIRHSSYCRRKARDPPRSRKRTCLSCTKAKAHCDTTHPACSRCLEKALDCSYERAASRHAAHELMESTDDSCSHPQSHGVDLGSQTQSTLELTESLHSTASVLPEDHLFVPDDLDISPDYGPPHVSITKELSRTMKHSFSAWARQQYHQQLQTHAHRRDFNLMPRLEAQATLGVIDVNALSSFGGELAPRPAKAFQLKVVRRSPQSLMRKFVIQQLVTYPYRFRPTASVPPFVHPSSIKTGSGSHLLNDCMLPPLARCAAIVSSWGVKNSANSSFCWNILRQEQERLAAECFTYDDFEAVAALQALCVYMLLRVSEQDEDVTTFDVPLIQTMLDLCARVTCIGASHGRVLANRLPSWEGWVLAESLRRTIIVLFIVDHFFDMSGGGHIKVCDSLKHWAEMLLPSTKTPWAAQRREDWEREYVLASDRDRPAFGDLLQQGAETLHANDTLDSWLANVDEFGAIVVSAASIVEQETIRVAH